ncbi:MAG TPA: stage II sporulation protein M [Pseudogracilibacillus sp.]|nr:stage II sporulation protein M [Pseudogracilibacillus sp.]
MRRKLSKQLMKQYILQNDTTYIFISILFLMGVIFGAIFVNSLSITQKEDLFYYLNQFFHQITNENMMNKTEVFKISFWQNVQLLGLIWILGISIIGFPIVFILLFLKGIVIGFTVGFLVSEMGLSGVGLVFGSIFPQNILFIPIYIFIAAASVGFSMKLIRKIFIRQSLVPK